MSIRLRRPGRPRRLRRRPFWLALRVLESLPGPFVAVLLAFLHARIAGQQPILVKRRAKRLVAAGQGPGDAVPDRAGLAGDAAATDGGQHAAPPLYLRGLEGLPDYRLQGEPGEVLLKRQPVHVAPAASVD